MKTKKSLGQHFLTSKRTIADIIRAADVKPGDTIIEIGPGKGVLTRALLEAGSMVVAIERDPELVEYLQKEFEKEITRERLKLVRDDVRSFEPKTYRLGPGTYKLVANIPYYITGEILRSFLSSDVQPERMVLLVQKEVVDRVTARDDKESILSMSVKAYGTPRKVGNVPARYFNPRPKVDSAILSIKHISQNFFNTINEEIFFKIIHAGFRHKRKLLIGNLVEVCSKETLKTAFAECGISEKTRAENLSLSNWKCLIQNIPQ